MDIGCGGGLLCESLARLGATVHGIDASEASIGVANSHASRDRSLQNIDYTHTTAEDLLSTGEQYDVVTALEIVEHVAHPQEFLGYAASLVKDNGALFLSTLNRTQKSWLVGIVAAEHLLRIIPVGTHDWQKFLEPQELSTLLTNIESRVQGSSEESETPIDITVEIENVAGMVFRPSLSTALQPSLQWALSQSDFNMNYIMHTRVSEKHNAVDPEPEEES